MILRAAEEKTQAQRAEGRCVQHSSPAPELGTEFEQGDDPFLCGDTVTLHAWEGQGKRWHINLNGSLEETDWQSPLMLQGHLLLPILTSNSEVLFSHLDLYK